MTTITNSFHKRIYNVLKKEIEENILSQNREKDIYLNYHFINNQTPYISSINYIDTGVYDNNKIPIRINLPDDNNEYIFGYTSNENINEYKNLILNAWITLKEFYTLSSSIRLHLFTDDGLKIPDNLVYIQAIELNGNIKLYIACKKDIITSIYGSEKISLMERSISNDIIVDSNEFINEKNERRKLVLKYNQFENIVIEKCLGDKRIIRNLYTSHYIKYTTVISEFDIIYKKINNELLIDNKNRARLFLCINGIFRFNFLEEFDQGFIHFRNYLRLESYPNSHIELIIDNNIVTGHEINLIETNEYITSKKPIVGTNGNSINRNTILTNTDYNRKNDNFLKDPFTFKFEKDINDDFIETEEYIEKSKSISDQYHVVNHAQAITEIPNYPKSESKRHLFIFENDEFFKNNPHRNKLKLDIYVQRSRIGYQSKTLRFHRYIDSISGPYEDGIFQINDKTISIDALMIASLIERMNGDSCASLEENKFKIRIVLRNDYSNKNSKPYQVNRYFSNKLNVDDSLSIFKKDVYNNLEMNRLTAFELEQDDYSDRFNSLIENSTYDNISKSNMKDIINVLGFYGLCSSLFKNIYHFSYLIDNEYLDEENDRRILIDKPIGFSRRDIIVNGETITFYRNIFCKVTLNGRLLENNIDYKTCESFSPANSIHNEITYGKNYNLNLPSSTVVIDIKDHVYLEKGFNISVEMIPVPSKVRTYIENNIPNIGIFGDINSIPLNNNSEESTFSDLSINPQLTDRTKEEEFPIYENVDFYKISPYIDGKFKSHEDIRNVVKNRCFHLDNNIIKYTPTDLSQYIVKDITHIDDVDSVDHGFIDNINLLETTINRIGILITHKNPFYYKKEYIDTLKDYSLYRETNLNIRMKIATSPDSIRITDEVNSLSIPLLSHDGMIETYLNGRKCIEGLTSTTSKIKTNFNERNDVLDIRNYDELILKTNMNPISLDYIVNNEADGKAIYYDQTIVDIENGKPVVHNIFIDGSKFITSLSNTYIKRDIDGNETFLMRKTYPGPIKEETINKIEYRIELPIKEYENTTNNQKVEQYTYGNITLFHKKGYVEKNIIGFDGNVTYIDENLTRVYIDGYLIPPKYYRFDKITSTLYLSDDNLHGAPYEIITSVSANILTLIDELNKEFDINFGTSQIQKSSEYIRDQNEFLLKHVNKKVKSDDIVSDRVVKNKINIFSPFISLYIDLFNDTTAPLSNYFASYNQEKNRNFIELFGNLSGSLPEGYIPHLSEYQDKSYIEILSDIFLRAYTDHTIQSGSNTIHNSSNKELRKDFFNSLIENSLYTIKLGQEYTIGNYLINTDKFNKSFYTIKPIRGIDIDNDKVQFEDEINFANHVRLIDKKYINIFSSLKNFKYIRASEYDSKINFLQTVIDNILL